MDPKTQEPRTCYGVKENPLGKFSWPDGSSVLQDGKSWLAIANNNGGYLPEDGDGIKYHVTAEDAADALRAIGQGPASPQERMEDQPPTPQAATAEQPSERIAHLARYCLPIMECGLRAGLDFPRDEQTRMVDQHGAMKALREIVHLAELPTPSPSVPGATCAPMPKSVIDRLYAEVPVQRFSLEDIAEMSRLARLPFAQWKSADMRIGFDIASRYEQLLPPEQRCLNSTSQSLAALSPSSSSGSPAPTPSPLGALAPQPSRGSSTETGSCEKSNRIADLEERLSELEAESTSHHQELATWQAEVERLITERDLANAVAIERTQERDDLRSLSADGIANGRELASLRYLNDERQKQWRLMKNRAKRAEADNATLRAELDGFHARCQEKPMSANPHAPGSDLFKAWDKGNRAVDAYLAKSSTSAGDGDRMTVSVAGTFGVVSELLDLRDELAKLKAPLAPLPPDPPSPTPPARDAGGAQS